MWELTLAIDNTVSRIKASGDLGHDLCHGRETHLRADYENYKYINRKKEESPEGKDYSIGTDRETGGQSNRWLH